jgi:hypothetical protein
MASGSTGSAGVLTGSHRRGDTRTGSEEAIGNVYNIGSSVETAILELAGRVISPGRQ